MNLLVLCTVACQEKRSNMSKHTLPIYSTTVSFWDSKNTYRYSSVKLMSFFWYFQCISNPERTCQCLMIVPLRTSILVFRSQETPIDGQPPALPPKQFKKNSWNQIHHSHSQQELDNHINETFDVPASPEKSTVSFCIQFNHSAFYWYDSPTFHELGSEAFHRVVVFVHTLQHFHYTYCLFASSHYFFYLLE